MENQNTHGEFMVGKAFKCSKKLGSGIINIYIFKIIIGAFG